MAARAFQPHSESRRTILPLVVHLIHKSMSRNDQGIQPDIQPEQALHIEHEIERLVLEDEETGRQIREVSMQLKPVPVEPDSVLFLRASIRPLVSILLTTIFAGIIAAWVASGWLGKQAEVGAVMKDILPAFLGIYGSVMGFWFGEHTADKAHGRRMAEVSFPEQTTSEEETAQQKGQQKGRGAGTTRRGHR